jgi:hypothetical protein
VSLRVLFCTSCCSLCCAVLLLLGSTLHCACLARLPQPLLLHSKAAHDNMVAPPTPSLDTQTFSYPSRPRYKAEVLPTLENRKVEVMWGDERIATLWAGSEAAREELPDHTFLVRGM